MYLIVFFFCCLDPKTAIYNITVKTSNHRYADADVNGFVRINGVSETDVHIGKNFHRGEIKQRIVELPYQKIVLYIAIRKKADNDLHTCFYSDPKIDF